MKLIKIILYKFILILLISSCKSSNIYSEEQLLETDIIIDPIIQNVIYAYGGEANWQKISNIKLKLTDVWPTFFWRLFANPWRNKKTELEFAWVPNSNNSRVTIFSEESKIFGIQNWATYSIEDSNINFKDNKKIKFHLPTMEYLFEFPFRIKEASVLKYGGKKIINGQDYYMILMSWNSFEPQLKIDQYIIYINVKTNLIDFLEFTVREQARFAYAYVNFTEFKQVKNIVFPTTIKAYFQSKIPSKSIGHQITVDSILVNEKLPRNYFVPNPQIFKNKY